MLEELFQLVKSVAGDSVINNPAVPNEQNNEVVAEATNTVASGLRNIVAGGGLGSLVGLFTGNQQNNKSSILSNPIVAMMIGHFAGKLMNKYNVGNQQANSIATTLIPGIIAALINRSNDSGDSNFSLDKLLRSITGGQTEVVAQQNPSFNLPDLISQLTGGQQPNAPQQPGLIDVIGQLAEGAQQQQARNGGGGLLDLIKGFAR